MQPTLEPGDRVLVRRLGQKAAPSLGSVVVTWHPQRSELRLSKRLSRVDSTGLWLLVSESGLFSRADLDRVQAAGAGAVLVGEALMRQPDVEAGLVQVIQPG